MEDSKETKLRKVVLFNAFLSIIVFCLIFIKNNHTSGGDMAIVVMNVSFGVLQILGIIIFGIFKKSLSLIKCSLIIIVICQILELSIFSFWGYQIHLILSNYGW